MLTPHQSLHTQLPLEGKPNSAMPLIRAPGRAWANAKHVWEGGATAYKCEGVTNRNTEHKRRVVTRRQCKNF